MKDNISMHSNYKFTKTIIWANHTIDYDYSRAHYILKRLIPFQWQLVLINDGSFTQNLNSLTGKKITVELTSVPNCRLSYNKYHSRKVWLTDCKHNKLAFAHSIWLDQVNAINLSKNIPIGQSLIKLKIDIHRDLHEIYYGYSRRLEKKFDSYGAIWGRKYTIYYESKPLTTIQEFFSPKILGFLEQ
nr:hypothetical protein [Gloiopeltis furcata]